MKVTRKPPDVTRHEFDPRSPPADMPHLNPGEAAVCTSNFKAEAYVSTRVTPRQLPGGRFAAAVVVEDVTVDLSLVVDVWLPRGASRKLAAHEDGHRQVSERVYAEVADRAIRAAADKVDGRRFQGEGESEDAAVKAANDAMTVAHQAMLDAYVAGTSKAANVIQEEFDALTAHGTRMNVAEADAIAKAWAKHPPPLWVAPKSAATKPATRPR